MLDKIREIVALHGRMPVDATTLDFDSDLYKSGLTSHATVNVMLALEDEFDVEFPDEALKKSTFASVRSIAQVVGSLIPA